MDKEVPDEIYLLIGVLKSVSSESDSANDKSTSRLGMGFDILHEKEPAPKSA